MRRLFLLLAPLLLAAAPPPPARPALWKVSDADTTLYLFGTFHALPAGYRWRDATLDRAFAAASTLVIETKVGDPPAMARLLLEMGTPATPPPPLLDRVPPKDRAALKAIVDRAGVPPAFLDRLETWAAAFLLVQPMMADLGVSGATGVEETLKAEFAARAAPVEELETVRAQLGAVDGLSEPDQRLFLHGFLAKAKGMRAEFARMIAAWARGDETAIARTFDSELKQSPGLREALLVRRNRNWATLIAERMERQPGTILVAVGAGHLAGRDSVQSLLRAHGLTVERVQ
jgi:uncharacterized protein YbaP (TraB family)